MSFDILYIEDNERERDDMVLAVSQFNSNAQGKLRRLSVTPIRDPDELEHALTEHYDLILADLHFPVRPGRTKEFQLLEITAAVQHWSTKRGYQKPPPIIAYTRREMIDLNKVLEHKEKLYDIWDKGSASPEYVAWRLSVMAADLARSRPDALLERLIRTMPRGATSWHSDVQEMAREYAAAWSEADQIERAGASITILAGKLGGAAFVAKHWPTMAKWEPLSRAVSQKTRGHARHVINVFWLGYYLIHHDNLTDWFSSAWRRITQNRRDMAKVSDIAALDAISVAWFYAGIFHDIANCAQEAHEVEKTSAELLEHFDPWLERDAGALKSRSRLNEDGDGLFTDLGPISGYVKSDWVKSIDPKKLAPDHGVVAAMAVTGDVTGDHYGCCAREAARAMMLHNIVGKLKPSEAAFLDWRDDPVVCLLLLCDQLQTWDRQRGDPTQLKNEGPDEASLVDLRVEKFRDHPAIIMGIEYVPPVHLHENPDSFGKVKVQLEMVLETRVKAAIRRIKEPWPFAFSVHFWLGGRPLRVEIAIPGPAGVYVPAPLPAPPSMTMGGR